MKTKYFLLLISAICIVSTAFGQSSLSKGDHYAEVNGVKLHYFVSGKGPFCLVPTPGWGPSINYLKNSLTPLEKYFTIVYYDTRISGQSTGAQ